MAHHKASEFTSPAINLGPHVAALGLKFYTGNMFPAKYKNQIFIAEHGSWNRSKKSGYQVSLVKMKNGKATGNEPFATGWLDEIYPRYPGAAGRCARSCRRIDAGF